VNAPAPSKWAVVEDDDHYRVARGLWVRRGIPNRTPTSIDDVRLDRSGAEVHVFIRSQHQYLWFVVKWSIAEMQRILRDPDYSKWAGGGPQSVAFIAALVAQESVLHARINVPLKHNVRLTQYEQWSETDIRDYIESW
jgi:hypothetical protein